MPHGGFFGAPEHDELTYEIRRFLAAYGNLMATRFAERHGIQVPPYAG